MRDPIVVISRLAFAVYFLFAFWAAINNFLTFSKITIVWLLYLIAIYLIAEQMYQTFGKRGIDLSFAFPLMFVVYCLHIVSTLLDGQNQLPILNRAEHFASFVFICYIVWIFFIKYLPHEVWRKHSYYTALLVFSVTSTLGVINELVELSFDSLFRTTLIGNKNDTSLDLLMNTLGAGIFLSVRLILGSAND
ncbi:MAG: hypothetical protein ABIH36_00060 [bacterium]